MYADPPLAPTVMPSRRRHCSRPGCAEPAAATLTYQYGQGTAWIDPLTAEREPHGYDLCARHADRVGVPHGWRLEDRRAVVDMLDRVAG